MTDHKDTGSVSGQSEALADHISRATLFDRTESRSSLTECRSRRSLLTIAAALTTASLLPHSAKATATLTKASAGYRDIPYQGRVCAQCVYFVFKPATAAGPQSQCKLIAGNINPAGWCDLWAPKVSS